MINIKEFSLGGWLKKLSDKVKNDGFLDNYGNYFIRRLLDMGMSYEEICWIIMPTAAAGTANQGQQVRIVIFESDIVYSNVGRISFRQIQPPLE